MNNKFCQLCGCEIKELGLYTKYNSILTTISDHCENFIEIPIYIRVDYYDL